MTKRFPSLHSLTLITLACFPIFVDGKPKVPAGAADDQAMLPAGDHVLLSFNVSAFFKSKTFAALSMKSAQAAELLGLALDQSVGVSSNNIDHVKVGMTQQRNVTTRPMSVVVTKKPVTFDDIKANLPAKNANWTSVKAAGRTVHVQGNDPNPARGQLPFCIAGSRLVLTGTVAAISKTLEQKNAANLTEGMRQALKEAGTANMLCIVIDVQRMLSEDAENNPGQPALPVDGIKELKMIVIKVNENEKFTASATFICTDAAAAGKFVQNVEMIRTLVKAQAPQAGDEEVIKAVGALTEAVAISRADNRVVANLTVDPAIVAAILRKVFVPAKAK